MFRAPVDVVTGFLGSGKTTLVRRLLSSPAGRRVAVIVNEVAALGIDGLTISGIDGVDRAVELAGGCICCEVSETRLARAVDALLGRVRPDLVVLETSGAADPAPVVARLRESGLVLDAVVAMVDAEYGGTVLSGELGRAQVAAADFVVVNRTDLAGPQQLAATEAALDAIAPRALRWRAVRADVDLDLLFATGMARLASRAGAGDRTNPMATGPGGHGMETRSLRIEKPVELEVLLEALAGLPANVWRAKGIVPVRESRFPLLVNAVRGRVESEWLALASCGGRTVLVGTDLDAACDGIAARLGATRIGAAPVGGT